MFQLKNFVSIAASMLNYVRSTTGKVTDLQPGSVTRTILEAPATEIEELYVQMFNGIKEAIPVAVYNSIDFQKLPPQYASGRVTVVALAPLSADMNIPKGTRFLSRDGRIYQTVKEMVWPAKNGTKDVMEFDVPVISMVAGIGQNLAAGEITAASLFPPDRFTLSSTAMINGSDTEADDSRDKRFADYISSLSRGTKTAMLYAARTASIKDDAGNIIEGVARASMTELDGSVTINIWGTNGAPSAELINQVTSIETGGRDTNGVVTPGYAAAGIQCSVGSMVGYTIDATFTVTLAAGYTLDATMKAAMKNAFEQKISPLEPGESITVEEMRVSVLIVPGLLTAELTNINNLVCGNNQVLLAGNLTITEAQPATLAVTSKAGDSNA
ncbi:TPA: baseplate J/gp47 family protein [Salmonella enterica subsp. enterica serovar Newport]